MSVNTGFKNGIIILKNYAVNITMHMERHVYTGIKNNLAC